MAFSQTLLPEFEEEMKNTRKLLECIPDGKLETQQHPRSVTLAQLATHVAQVPGWTKHLLDEEMLDLSLDMKPFVAASRAELLATFDRGVLEARGRICAASDEYWQTMWTFKVGGDTVFSMPRAAVMRSTIMNHLIHHRAQLSLYLQLDDVAIPGMYRPSADEKPLGDATGQLNGAEPDRGFSQRNSSPQWRTALYP
jgi:uncharacterized damage-inducible protein DinB